MFNAVKSFTTDLLHGDPAAVWHSAQIVATALVSGTLGAWLVAGRTQSVQAAISATATRPKHDKSTSDHESSSSDENDAESNASNDDDAPTVQDGSAPVIDARKYRDFKMVLVVRNDLGMTKGKVAAQCCHACLAAYKHCVRHNPKARPPRSLSWAWEYSGQAKVALKVNSEDEMLELEALAQSLSLSAKSIRDAGRTQIAAGSRTVLAIGPGPVEIIDQVTKHLKLF
ncbi:peptidyl-tRNA hydrolase [Allomyces macrogynus ATCC 38327]|uniref:peptidyl-tRNA hydrolase n=1 Tax=Allomyces macrogynus (strain ATCC 38327) TaxID=578462 RepID=A0A0L0TA58_ALLM3|nr:peptidyl-tRNA hydrolase [Allomyces macrogynus ATCC 38327]|eukprot:KNE71627.1 peptidyl-tRNA hydrolase [Allomyces macrogynus ATCC 38327]